MPLMLLAVAIGVMPVMWGRSTLVSGGMGPVAEAPRDFGLVCTGELSGLMPTSDSSPIVADSYP